MVINRTQDGLYDCRQRHYPVKGSEDTMYTVIKVTQVCTKSIIKDTELY